MLEVSRNKDGEFSQVARAMTLSGGHTKAVHGLAFNPECTRVVTASIDGSWCVSGERWFGAWICLSRIFGLPCFASCLLHAAS